jgi:DNA-binding CsgD family transcriptional regulator
MEPEGWGAVVEKIGLAYGAIASGFFSHSLDNKLMSSFMWGVDPAEIERYGRDFACLNPWFTTPGVMLPNRISTDRSLDKIHKNSNFFKKTVLYQEWGRQQDFRHSMGGALLDMGGNQLNFTFYRAENQGEFTESEIRNYRALSKHLMRALDISNKFQTMKYELSFRDNLLDRLNLGVAILDGAIRIKYQNKFCEKCIGANPTKYHSAMLGAINKAKAEHESQLVETIGIDNQPLMVLVLPPAIDSFIKSGLFHQASPYIQIIITDPAQATPFEVDRLAKRWSFTNMEARIAQQLIAGKSLRDISEQLNLTLSTVQWYSKQLMQKVGVKRQAEFCIALLQELSVSPDNLFR